MLGIAAQTGMSGSAWLPFTKKLAIGARKNICIRYMLNERREMTVIHRGASFCSMQVNIRKAPKVASSTLGVQNSHDHSSRGVSMSWLGVPFHQNDQPVKAAPMARQVRPIFIFLARFQVRCFRM